MADQVFNILRWFYERFFPSHVVKWFYQRPTKPVNYGAYYDPIELHRSYLRDAEEQEIVFPAVTNINHLPYHTLLKIFSYLSMDDRLLDACLVCKYWHEICCDPSFWRVINLPRRRLITNEVLLRVVGYGREIHSIDISELHNKGLTSEAVLSVSKACPKLRKLVISSSMPRAEEKLIIQIIKNCPHLKHLGIDMLNLTDETMFAISTRLKNLEVLSVNKNYSITDDGVIAVIRRCKKIHTLGLDEIEITDRTLNELAAREVRNPTMIDLNVQFGKFTPKGIEVLGKLRNLRSLEITRCKGLLYENLPPIITNMPKLTTLGLCMQSELDDRTAKLIAKNLKHLKVCHVSSMGITDVGLAYIAKHCKKIEFMDLGYTKVTEKGVKHLLENLKRLQMLGLMRCDEANTEEIEKLVFRYPHISFSTFLQDAKRMLAGRGCWDHSVGGVLTEEKIVEQMQKKITPKRRKRLIGSGGVTKFCVS